MSLVNTFGELFDDVFGTFSINVNFKMTTSAVLNVFITWH